ncbi:MAG: formate dehydrogenase accessory sulfurtransferase FdhD [Chloroflexota bacterium]|nr:MAG: sulfurtransferase FdhD [Bellilinea sp.]
MRKLEAVQPVQFLQYRNGTTSLVEDGLVISEANVSLTVNGTLWLSWMCTPMELEDLAVGFLFNEGVIQSIHEVEILRPCDDGGNVDVWLNHPVEKPQTWRKTSGCTGGITSDDAQKRTNPILNVDIFPAEKLVMWMEQLFDSQQLYRKTRGVHCSLLTDGEKIIAMAEDIGRHNTLDKIAGKILRQSLQLNQCIILTTGRISSEMLQKAARIGASVVISRSSPTSLSIQLADQYGITLIGYARRSQFNIYTHPQRIRSALTSGIPEKPATAYPISA